MAHLFPHYLAAQDRRLQNNNFFFKKKEEKLSQAEANRDVFGEVQE